MSNCMECGAPLSEAAIVAHLPGCAIQCPACMEKYHWQQVALTLSRLKAARLPDGHPAAATIAAEITRLESLPPDAFSLPAMLAKARAPKHYPTTGIIGPNDPSIYGPELLGHEGQTWESFRHPRAPRQEVNEPFRRGISAGFGATEDGDV